MADEEFDWAPIQAERDWLVAKINDGAITGPEDRRLSYLQEMLTRHDVLAEQSH